MSDKREEEIIEIHLVQNRKLYQITANYFMHCTPTPNCFKDVRTSFNARQNREKSSSSPENA
jgi:hypothetical protein